MIDASGCCVKPLLSGCIHELVKTCTRDPPDYDIGMRVTQMLGIIGETNQIDIVRTARA
jgi:hypothetical protein